MTLRNSPLAIDGARIDSATLRIAAYANGNEGIISKGDLKVSPLTIPGVGLRVAHGAATVLNRYQSSIDQAYVVSNVNEAIIDSSMMPAPSASFRSHLVVVTVGDPEFSQAGHPWMLSSDPPLGEEETFDYVRFHVIPNVPSSTKTFASLGLSYPAYALARIDVPANTSTITSEMIVDLRRLANPRNTERIEHIPSATNNLLNGGGTVGNFENWPSTVWFDLEIPEWAVRAKVHGFVEGALHTKAGQGSLRIAFADGGATTITNINESAPANGADRKHYNIGGEIAIPASYRGTTRRIRIEGTVANEASKGFLDTDSSTSGLIRVRLEEEAT